MYIDLSKINELLSLRSLMIGISGVCWCCRLLSMCFGIAYVLAGAEGVCMFVCVQIDEADVIKFRNAKCGCATFTRLFWILYNRQRSTIFAHFYVNICFVYILWLWSATEILIKSKFNFNIAITFYEDKVNKWFTLQLSCSSQPRWIT